MHAGEYRERLLPAWWVLALALGFIALIAIAYGAALGSGTGLSIFLAGTVIAIAVTWLSSPVIVADRAGLRVGRARLPRSAIGGLTILEPADFADLRHPKTAPTAFAMLRPSRSRRGVRIAVDDPQDPHPAWIVTSRRPEALVAALE